MAVVVVVYFVAGAIILGTLAAMAANILCVLFHSQSKFQDQLEVFPAHGMMPRGDVVRRRRENRMNRRRRTGARGKGRRGERPVVVVFLFSLPVFSRLLHCRMLQSNLIVHSSSPSLLLSIQV